MDSETAENSMMCLKFHLMLSTIAVLNWNFRDGEDNLWNK